MANVGILGGSFNPLHNGHLHLAQEFHDRLGLDSVLLIPVNLPPHKAADGIAPPGLRLAMCRAVCKGRPWLSATDIELRRGGKSYTCDTLRELHKARSGDRFFLLMGADMFLTFGQWRQPDAIARLSVLCCARRSGEDMGALKTQARRLERLYGARCRVVETPVLPMSSTEVRGLVRRGGNVSGLVPPPVAALIAEKGLYKDG